MKLNIKSYENFTHDDLMLFLNECLLMVKNKRLADVNGVFLIEKINRYVRMTLAEKPTYKGKRRTNY